MFCPSWHIESRIGDTRPLGQNLERGVLGVPSLSCGGVAGGLQLAALVGFPCNRRQACVDGPLGSGYAGRGSSTGTRDVARYPSLSLRLRERSRCGHCADRHCADRHSSYSRTEVKERDDFRFVPREEQRHEAEWVRSCSGPGETVAT